MKGFFSIFLVLVSIIIIFDLLVVLSEQNNSFSEIKTELIAIENASKDRSILEKNVDKIVSKSLEEIVFSDTSIQEGLNLINSRLSNYLKEKAFIRNIFSDSKQQITKNKLNDLSVLSIFRTKNLSFAQYTFTSDITKTTIVSKKLGKNILLEFTIPINYVQETTG
jgi:acid phosphatase class B